MLKSTVVPATRDFGAKKKKVKANPDEPSEFEVVEEPVAQPEPVAAPMHNADAPWLNVTDKLNLDQSLF